MWEMQDGMGWWMLFGMILFLLFWGLVIWAVVTVVSKFGGRQSSEPSGGEPPIEIAKRRYARGEISKDEFDRLRSDLQ